MSKITTTSRYSDRLLGDLDSSERRGEDLNPARF